MDHEITRRPLSPALSARPLLALVPALVVAIAAGCDGGTDQNSTSPSSTGSGQPRATVAQYPKIRLSEYLEDWDTDMLGAPQMLLDGVPTSWKSLGAGEVVLARGSETKTNLPNGWSSYSRVFDAVELTSIVAGPIDAIDLAHARLVVLGREIHVTGHTCIDDGADVDCRPGAVAKFKVTDFVRVSGYDSPTGPVAATRIVRQAAGPARMVGIVSALDTRATLFRLGSAVVEYGAASIAGFTAPTEGDRVEVVGTRADTGMPIKASVLRLKETPLDPPKDARVFATGFVSRVEDPGSGPSRDIVVTGQRLRLGQDCEGPALQSLRSGALVHVWGVASADGVLHTADQDWPCKIDDYDQDAPITLLGRIDALDLSQGVLQVLGYTVQLQVSTLRQDSALEVGSMASVDIANALSARSLIAARVVETHLTVPQISGHMAWDRGTGFSFSGEAIPIRADRPLTYLRCAGSTGYVAADAASFAAYGFRQNDGGGDYVHVSLEQVDGQWVATRVALDQSGDCGQFMD